MTARKAESLAPAVALSIFLHILLALSVGLESRTAEEARVDRYTVDLIYRVPALQVDASRMDAAGPDSEQVPVLKAAAALSSGRATSEETAERKDEPEKSETTLREEEANRSMIEAKSAVAQTTPEENIPVSVSHAKEAYDYTALLEGLRERIASSLVYPRMARIRGIEGTVVLLLKLDREGNLAGLSVKSSSGSDILDRAARQLVEGVLPYRHGAGRTVRVEIPIDYICE
jgi:TonB family protein